MSGCCAKRRLYRVPLPTPEGPEMMMGRRSVGAEADKRVSFFGSMDY